MQSGARWCTIPADGHKKQDTCVTATEERMARRPQHWTEDEKD